MKTKLMVILLLMLGLAGCTDDSRDPARGTSATNLLVKYNWVNQYVDNNNATVKITYQFNNNLMGTEKYEYVPEYGEPENDSYSFIWGWHDETYRTLVIDYGGGDLSYIDNVFVEGRVLTGVLDGQNIILTGYDK